jgi:serine/threonine protein kinase
MPITLKDFINELTSCYLLDAEQCALCLTQFDMDADSGEAEVFAAQLVEHGHLTQFQASAGLQERSSALVIGDYHVLDIIGSGGMGQVYKARHRIMKRLVAIKIMHTAKATNPNLVQRFYREVEAAARLSHPNIVTAYDAGETPGGLYLAMEYVDGVDLSVILKTVGAPSVNQAVNITLQVARGLAYAHRHRVVHRDIKPGNLLLDRDGTVKILDMGLARFTEAEAAEVSLTMIGPLMGTVEYMAPEHAANPKNADHRSDIYSLGCTMYRLLTGHLPYGGETAVEKVIAQREHPIPLLSDLVGDIPESLQGIFARMVAKAPEDRYQSMDECLADLLEIGSQAEECDISGLTNLGSPTATTVFDEGPPDADTAIDDQIEPAPPTLDAVQTDSGPLADEPITPDEDQEPVAIDSVESESTLHEESPSDIVEPAESSAGSDWGDESSQLEYSDIPDEPDTDIDDDIDDEEETAADEPHEANSHEGESASHGFAHGLKLLLAATAIVAGIGAGLILRSYFASSPVAAPTLGAQWGDLLGDVDVDKDVVAGKWDRLLDGSLMAFADEIEHSRMTAGAPIKPNYQVRMIFTRYEGAGGVGLILPLGSGNQVSLEIDGAQGKKSALGSADYGVRVEEDGPSLSDGVRHTCIVSVENSGEWTRIAVTLDGRELIRYEGPVNELHLSEEWDSPAGRLGFGVQRYVSAQVHELSVRALASRRLAKDKEPSTRP